MFDIIYAVEQQVIGKTLTILWSDGKFTHYDAVELGCEWFRMSNDSFYDKYKFNFNPYQWGLYEKCRKIVFGGLA